MWNKTRTEIYLPVQKNTPHDSFQYEFQKRLENLSTETFTKEEIEIQ